MRRSAFLLPLVLLLLAGCSLVSVYPHGEFYRVRADGGGGDPLASWVIGDTTALPTVYGVDPETGEFPGDVTREAKLVIESLRGELHAVDMDLENLVWIQLSCADAGDRAAFDQVYSRYQALGGRRLPVVSLLASETLLDGHHFALRGAAILLP